MSVMTGKLLGATALVSGLGVAVVAVLLVPDLGTDLGRMGRAPAPMAEPGIAVAEDALPPAAKARQETAPLSRDLPAAPEAAIAPQPQVMMEDTSALAGNRAITTMVAPQASAEMGIAIVSEPPMIVEGGRDDFANADTNPVKVTREAPVSTFSVDVDTASWSIARRWIDEGQLPPKDAVRIEEFVNAFDYDYSAPRLGEGAPFAVSSELVRSPWMQGAQLLRIGIQGAALEPGTRPPLDLTLLVDTSGSMAEPDKLPLLVASFKMMLGQLRPEDRVSIVTYAGSAGVALEPTPASDRRAIEAALESLTSGGGTAGAAGIEAAYDLAGRGIAEGRMGRVILATDGDFNIGIADPEALKGLIEKKRDSGIYLSVLGFGRDNLGDRTMQTLAQNGNGTAAYIGTLSDARRALVDQFEAATVTIAEDVKIQIEFNPAVVQEYRLLGYETRALAREDFSNDAVDAGEVGSGHAVTALYEIVPVGSEAVAVSDLRYATPEPASGPLDELGYLKLRYKAPGAEVSELLELPLANREVTGSGDTRFAAAIAGFGALLRGDTRLGSWSFADAVSLAQGALGTDAFGHRRQAVETMRLAVELAR